MATSNYKQKGIDMATLRDFIMRELEHGFITGWAEKMLEAQSKTKYGEYDRIKAGKTDGVEGDRVCHDCGVVEGEYHVPGCDVECCPKCGRQWISCKCRFVDEGKISEHDMMLITEKYKLN